MGYPRAMAKVHNRPLRKTVVLIGLMASGKSSIGRRLAARLGSRFTDADEEIEAAAGCPIEDIFEFHGEDAFRDGERRVIARLLDGDPHVLATGGGAFMDADTRARIRERGVSVWLRADLDLLLQRIKRRRKRPLLKNGDPKTILEGLIAARYPVYAEADITVETVDAPHESLVDEIIERLSALPESGLAATSHTEPGETTPGETTPGETTPQPEANPDR